MVLDAEQIADVEGDAAAMYAMAGLDGGSPVNARRLCVLLCGTRPKAARGLIREAESGELLGRWVVRYSHRASYERASWLIGHELAEWWYRRSGLSHEEKEARCDALGAALVCPRPAFLGAVKRFGHSPKRLGLAFRVTRSCALLRLGEATGRPTALLGRRVVVRGEPFEWPTTKAELKRAVFAPPRGVHPVRLADERLWGLLAN